MDSDQCKLFVGGIPWESKEETLKDHFQKYGEVVEAVIMRDRITGSARGFGFVQFSDPSAAENALQEKKHVILGRTVSYHPLTTLFAKLFFTPCFLCIFFFFFVSLMMMFCMPFFDGPLFLFFFCLHVSNFHSFYLVGCFVV